VLEEIDERAETLFGAAGMTLPRVTMPAGRAAAAKALFVHGRPPVGFVRVDEVDGLAHVEQLSVLPAQMRRGLGTALLGAACDWAVEQGYPAVTLITYADVAWNGPFYAARGFTETDQITPGLAELRDWERSVGLDEVGRRIVMRRELTG
jgi:GNAT superfamily N-acetyltransferase